MRCSSRCFEFMSTVCRFPLESFTQFLRKEFASKTLVKMCSLRPLLGPSLVSGDDRSMEADCFVKIDTSL